MKNFQKFALVAVAMGLLSGCGENVAKIPSQKITGVRYSEVRKANDQKADLPTVGKPKVLVIPVDFSDYTCDMAARKSNKDCDSIKKDIEASFFGKSNDMYWESLSSYYSKSSYGKLKIEGKVTDWYRATKTTVQYANDDDNAIAILREAVEWARSKSSTNLKEFDSNNDGYIDAVELVYSCPMNYTKQGIKNPKFFWAFTFWDFYGSPANVEKPVAFSYVWESAEFMYENSKNTTIDGVVKPDAHTFIHETGHLLGAPDYYTYDEKDWGAAGALDMMDYNVGDHNAYTKVNYDWISPIVPEKGTQTVTLRPFESSGDCLLLTPSWNGTMMDEYLLIEYYTPTGLNEMDSREKYASAYPLMFSEAGIKVYHVDSRLGKFSYNRTSEQYEFVTYTNLFTGSSGSNSTIVKVGNSNTASRSGVAKNKLLHLLESSGENSFDDENSSGKYTNVATNETLWKEGMTFNLEDGPFFNAFAFNNDKLNDGKDIDDNKISTISFTIDSINPKGATITFTIN